MDQIAVDGPGAEAMLAEAMLADAVVRDLPFLDVQGVTADVSMADLLLPGTELLVCLPEPSPHWSLSEGAHQETGGSSAGHVMVTASGFVDASAWRTLGGLGGIGPHGFAQGGLSDGMCPGPLLEVLTEQAVTGSPRFIPPSRIPSSAAASAAASPQAAVSVTASSPASPATAAAASPQAAVCSTASSPVSMSPAAPASPAAAAAAASAAAGAGPLAGIPGVPGADGVRLLTDNELLGTMSAAQRLRNRAEWLELSAVAELTRRRYAEQEASAANGDPVGQRAGEFAAEEISWQAVCSGRAAGERMELAEALAARLPATFARMADGGADSYRALIVHRATRDLSAEDAAAADAILAEEAPSLTPESLRRRAARVAMALDPEAAAKRKKTGAKHKRVEMWPEDSGNAALAGREMEPADALAAAAYYDALARTMRKGGVPGTLRELRHLAFTDRNTGRDPLDRIPGHRDGMSGHCSGQSGPGENDSGQVGPGQYGPGRSDPGRSDPGQSGSGQSDPGQSSAGQYCPGQYGPGQGDPGQNPDPPDRGTPGGAGGGEPSGRETGQRDDGIRDDLLDDGYREDEPEGRDPWYGIDDDDSIETDDGANDGGPAPGSPAGTGSPLVPANITILVPVGTLLGWSGAPGEASRLGPLDPRTTRDLVRAASRHPNTRWCVTFTGPDGTAVGHGCAPGRHSWPQPDMAGRDHGDSSHARPSGDAGRAGPGGESGRAGPGGDGDRLNGDGGRAGPYRGGGAGPAEQAAQAAQATRTAAFLDWLGVAPEPIARGACDHRHAEDRYTPSRKLAHLIRARTATCPAPSCGARAEYNDLDHTVPWPEGRTDECNLAPPCRHHHRVKQAPGWKLEQTEPGVMRWTTPSGRVFVTRPTEY